MKEFIGTLQDFERLTKDFGIPTLYRGQANALHGLLPGIGRPHPKYVSTPGLERSIFEQFRARARPYITPPVPASDWDWLILAQHHGLKTRLLDWTADWRIALYFATLPHDEMYQVPFSVFVLPRLRFSSYDRLPRNPFTLKRDYCFQPSHIHSRVIAQSSYMTAHHDPFAPMERSNVLQFSFYPYREYRDECANFLASSKITPAELFPGLDGICRSLVEEPRLTAQIDLDFPPASNNSRWRRVPRSVVGKTVGELEEVLFHECKLAAVLDFVALPNIIGRPCYQGDEPFGFLKYASEDGSSFMFLTPDGTRTVTLHDGDDCLETLRLHPEHVEQLIPRSQFIFVRPAKPPRAPSPRRRK